MTHEVMVRCNCEDIENCSMELYVSDIRIAVARITWLEFERDLLSDCVDSMQGDQAA